MDKSALKEIFLDNIRIGIKLEGDSAYCNVRMYVSVHNLKVHPKFWNLYECCFGGWKKGF